VFVHWVFFAGSALSLFVFRRTRPDAERPYRCPLYPFVPALFLLLATAMAIASFLKSDLTSRILGPGILLAGSVAFVAYRRWGKLATDD
jgi:APA family basic amino acid/polyamine antiporter